MSLYCAVKLVDGRDVISNVRQTELIIKNDETSLRIRRNANKSCERVRVSFSFSPFRNQIDSIRGALFDISRKVTSQIAVYSAFPPTHKLKHEENALKISTRSVNSMS